MRYFSNLEFYPRTTELGGGIQRRRNLLTALMYVLLSLGIFSHDVVSIAPLGFRPITWSALAASFILGLALLPPAIRWINIKTTEPSPLQVITAFSIGFFVDLSSKEFLPRVMAAIVKH